MISVVILTKNNSKSIRATLESVRMFPEVVIYDTGSTDDTLAIAQSFSNTKIITGTLNGFGPTRNKAASYASFDWVLALDSDEIVSKELQESIQTTSLDPSQVYRLKRVNFFLDQKMRSCSGWGKDFVNRLYNQKTHFYSDDQVHEKIVNNPNNETTLEGELLHTPYLEVGDLLKKMHHYSDLFASQHQNLKTDNVSMAKVLLSALFAFIKSYIFKGGFLQGSRGFIISSYIAHCCFYKYLKVWEKQITRQK